MKATLALLLIGLTAVFAATSYESILENGWTMVPDEDGHLKMVSLEDLTFEYALAHRAGVKAQLRLYTRENPVIGEELIMGDVNNLLKSHYNPNNPTRVICHGWMGDGESRVITLNRDAYLSIGAYNIIGIDWSEGGGTINYIKARANVNEAATQVANYLKFLHEHGWLNYSNLYLIGHSLGAHVMGMTGKFLGGQADTIYGLDPAMPLFFEDKPNERLSVGDARYVQTIQTNVGVLGFDIPIGDGSFYPNWGRDQPGCGLDLAGTCAHYRSWAYLAESITDDNFWAIKCKSYTSILDKYCPASGSYAIMGGQPADHKAVGVYYLTTNKNEPYSKGRFF